MPMTSEVLLPVAVVENKRILGYWFWCWLNYTCDPDKGHAGLSCVNGAVARGSAGNRYIPKIARPDAGAGFSQFFVWGYRHSDREVGTLGR